MSSVSGESADAHGRDVKVNQLVAVVPDGILGDLDVSRAAQSIRTRVHLNLGQMLVLGTSGAADKNATLYYIVRAALHDGTRK